MTQPQTAQEVVFYQDASPVYISSTRAILLNQTFILRNIASVSVGKVKYYFISEGFFLLLGFALFFWGIRTPMNEIGLILALVPAGLISLIGSSLFITIAVRKPYYVLLIGSAGGQVETITSKDKKYITSLVNALNAALAYNG